MAVLIFKIRFVPEDEVQEVRELLQDNNIDFYETSAGTFGISMPGLWLRNEDQLQDARQLVEEYQQLRQHRAREDYALQQSQGTARTFGDMFQEAPLRYITFILVILLICYITIFAFFKI
ncbi:MAG: DUF6164 family protein [Gammaproteobacteria bacterium]